MNPDGELRREGALMSISRMDRTDAPQPSCLHAMKHEGLDGKGTSDSF